MRVILQGKRKGKRGRGANGKIPELSLKKLMLFYGTTFGLLKRGDKVYTKIIPNAKSKTLLPIIKEKIIPDSVVYSDSFKAYDALDIS